MPPKKASSHRTGRYVLNAPGVRHRWYPMQTPIEPVTTIKTAQVRSACQLKKKGATSANKCTSTIQITTGQSTPCFASSATPAPGSGMVADEYKCSVGVSEWPLFAGAAPTNEPLAERRAVNLSLSRVNKPIG